MIRFVLLRRNTPGKRDLRFAGVPKSTLWHSSVLTTVTAQDSALPRPLLMLLLPLTSVALLARLAAVVLVKT
eukprot:COSAG06_NODE_13728_length_1225_cov_0.627886_1_plen_72_part_00